MRFSLCSCPGAADTLTASYLATLRNETTLVKNSQQALSSGGVSIEFTTIAKSKPWLGAAEGAYKYAGGAATSLAFGYCVGTIVIIITQF